MTREFDLLWKEEDAYEAGGSATEVSEAYEGRPSEIYEDAIVRAPAGPLRSDLRGKPSVSTLPKVNPVRVDCCSIRDDRGDIPGAL